MEDSADEVHKLGESALQGRIVWALEPSFGMFRPSMRRRGAPRRVLDLFGMSRGILAFLVRSCGQREKSRVFRSALEPPVFEVLLGHLFGCLKCVWLFPRGRPRGIGRPRKGHGAGSGWLVVG